MVKVPSYLLPPYYAKMKQAKHNTYKAGIFRLIIMHYIQKTVLVISVPDHRRGSSNLVGKGELNIRHTVALRRCAQRFHITTDIGNTISAAHIEPADLDTGLVHGRNYFKNVLRSHNGRTGGRCR